MDQHSHIIAGQDIAALRMERDELASQVKLLQRALAAIDTKGNGNPYAGLACGQLARKALLISPNVSVAKIEASMLRTAAIDLWHDKEASDRLEELAALKLNGTK